ncbi:hypothetical protein M422DRAFT_182653, partial [Sphaerobolus stellatus SS14]
SESLLEKGYIPSAVHQVHGIIQRSSSFNMRESHIHTHILFLPNKLHLHYGDLTDSTNLVYVIATVKPIKIYNFGMQSHVKVSFEMAEYTGDVDVLGTLHLLDAIRSMGFSSIMRARGEERC